MVGDLVEEKQSGEWRPSIVLVLAHLCKLNFSSVTTSSYGVIADSILQPHKS